MAYIFAEADKLRNQGQSLEAAKKYQEIAESSDDARIVGSALHMAGVSLSQSGDKEGPLELFKKAEDHYKKSDDKFSQARVSRDHGIFLLNQERFDDAAEVLRQSIEALSSQNQPGELAMSEAKLAVVLAKQGKARGARDLALSAVDNANNSANSFYVATAYQEAARVEFLGNNYRAMLAPLYAALGALKLESDPHAKRHAELFLSLAHVYSKLGNTAMSEKAAELAEKHLAELDPETAERIKGYFQ